MAPHLSREKDQGDEKYGLSCPIKRVSQLTLCWVGFNSSAPVPELSCARVAGQAGRLGSRAPALELQQRLLRVPGLGGQRHFWLYSPVPGAGWPVDGTWCDPGSSAVTWLTSFCPIPFLSEPL